MTRGLIPVDLTNALCFDHILCDECMHCCYTTVRVDEMFTMSHCGKFSLFSSDTTTSTEYFGRQSTVQEKGGGDKQGPNLNGLLGRTAGTKPGYSYSTANKTSGVVWNEDNLFEYLLAPKKYMKVLL